MANIFRKKDEYIDRVNRSTFDLSFVNNLTMKFGAITPVCLLPASFGDSFQINARFNLQLLPTVFPIQTQLYVRLHFVYVRTRTLWEDWMSFFGGDETVTPPWINPTVEDTPQGHKKFNIADDLQTGTLADYLGVPTTITGSYGGSVFASRSVDLFDFKDNVPALNAPLSGSPIVNNLSFPTLSNILSSNAAFSDIFITNFANKGSYGYVAPRCFCVTYSVKYDTPTQNITLSIPLSRFDLLRQMVHDYDSKPIVGFAIYEATNKAKLWSGQLNVVDIKDNIITYRIDLGKSISSFTLAMIFELRNELYQKDYV